MKSWVKIIIALFAGLSFGIIFGNQFQIITVVGNTFINLLKMIAGLLVFVSIITSISHINDPKKMCRIWARTISFYVITTLIAIGLGISIGFLLKPGASLSYSYDFSVSATYYKSGLLDFISSMVPSNPFAAFANGNILQIIVFAIFFAFAIILSGDKGKPAILFFESISSIMNKLTCIIMKFAPYGVFALIVTTVGSNGVNVIIPLAKLLLCNFIACAIHVVVVFGFSLHILSRTKIGLFLRGMKDAILVAFTTSSSSATLPVSIECARNKLGVSDDISGFVLSLGSTINMNGAAIGQAIAAIFIAQAYGVELTILKIAILTLTVLLSAVGTAGIPGQSIIMLSVVLNSIGLPLEGIALVAGVDRIRDMISTVVNILGDAVAMMYVAHKEKRVTVVSKCSYV